MTVISVLTDNGVKKVRIAGEQPTPEEIELMRNEFSDMGGTQTMPMLPSLPQEAQENIQAEQAQADIPTISADPLSPQEREQAKQQARQRANVVDDPGMGTVATKLVRPRFSGEKPSQGEVAAGKGMGRAIGSLAGVAAAAAGNDKTAKRIDQNIANIPYEEGIPGLAEGVTQFLTLASPATQVMKAKGVGPILQTVTASGVSGGLGFSGQQERLSDLVQQFPAIANPVTDFLASDVDDSFAVGRLKNALEFAGLDVAVMLPFVKTLRQTRGQARNAKPNGEVELAQEIDKAVPKQNPNAVVRPLENVYVYNRDDSHILESIKLGEEAINKKRTLNKKATDSGIKKVTKNEPVYYHGAKLNFNNFKTSGQGQVSDLKFKKYGPGVYLMDNANAGRDVIRFAGDEGVIIETKINGNIATKDNYFNASQEVFNLRKDGKVKPGHKYEQEAIQNILKKQGYDGINMGGEVVVFDPKNVKIIKRTPVSKFTKDGVIQGSSTGQIQLPDKVVEAVTKPFEKVLNTIDAGMQKSGLLSDKAIRPISSRIEELSPRMVNKLYEFELDQNMLAGQYMNKAIPFMESFKKMKPADRKLLTKHALNSDTSEVYSVIQRYNTKLPGMKRQFDDLRQTFDDLHKLATDNGIDVPYRKDYLPRIMKDYDGYRKHIGVDAKSEIDKAINQAYLDKNKVPQGGALPTNPKPLTQFEEREAIRKYLEGTKYTGDGTPGFMKNRVIDKIEDDILPFYGGLEENIQNYINNVTYRVAKNRFTGKVDGVEGYTELLSKLNQRGKVADADTIKINELIDARLSGGEQSIGQVAQLYRDGMYLTSIGNPISTITQASEFMLNAYRNGTLNTLTTAPKTLAKKGITVKDLGLDDIAKEFSDPLSQSQKGKFGVAKEVTNKLLRKTLGAVQFKRMDELMKESNLNGAFLKARKKVANVRSKEYQDFAKEMSEYYGPETKKFLDALKRGDANDPNVKTYLFSQLAKTQPISLSEYSEFYLRNPGARPAYFLKSFALKQLETTRRDITRKLASGNANEIRDGMRQGIRLSVLFGGGMTANNLFKDYLLDRDDKPGMTGDQVPKMENVAGAAADAILTLFGLSRYSVYRIKDDGLYGVVDMFLPPKATEVFELGKSSLSGDFDKAGRIIEKNIPIGGKIYSQHFGAGADYKRKKRIKEYKAKKRAIENIGKMPSIPNIPELELD